MLLSVYHCYHQKQTKLEETQWIRRLSQRKQEKPLPNPFQLPENFPSIVEAALLKKALFGHARTKFLTVVAQSIYFHKRYPTNEEYFHVVQQRIFEKWPFLNVNGLVSGNSWYNHFFLFS